MDYVNRAKKFRTKKRLGQNFLIDKKVIDKILSYVNEDDCVLEIGSGIGFVTEKLVEKARRVYALELDEDAVEVLKKIKKDNFTLVHGDILKTDIADLTNEKVKIVANIPYYITSPILLHLLGEIDELEHKNRSQITEIILMVQLEVAKRLVAHEKSPSKQYGMLSVLAQFFADVEIISNVSKRSFYPSPKVDSALVRIKINSRPRVEAFDYSFLRKVVKASFATRRKNIKNSLCNAGFSQNAVVETLEELNIPPNARGETFSIEEFTKLAKVLHGKLKGQMSGKN